MTKGESALITLKREEYCYKFSKQFDEKSIWLKSFDVWKWTPDGIILFLGINRKYQSEKNKLTDNNQQMMILFF